MSLQVFAITAPVFHVLGILTAVQAIMETRTSQGAVAWAPGETGLLRGMDAFSTEDDA